VHNDCNKLAAFSNVFSSYFLLTFFLHGLLLCFTHPIHSNLDYLGQLGKSESALCGSSIEVSLCPESAWLEVFG
jgi:hypothetical protein